MSNWRGVSSMSLQQWGLLACWVAFTRVQSADPGRDFSVIALGELKALPEEKVKPSSPQKCTGIGQEAADQAGVWEILIKERKSWLRKENEGVKGPRRLGSFYPWRQAKLDCTRQATWSRCVLGLGNLQRTLAAKMSPGASDPTPSLPSLTKQTRTMTIHEWQNQKT